MKKFLALTLTLCMVLSLAAVFGVTASAATEKTEGKTHTMTAVYDNGNYTVALRSGDSVTINTAEELRLLSLYTNAGKVTKGVRFILTADITLGAQYDPASDLPLFTPIGNTAETPFCGVFLGSGHTISNLYVKENGVAGLFGYTENTSVQQLSLNNAAISGTDYTGAVIGHSKYHLSLVNVSVNGKVTGADHVGGLIGHEESGTAWIINSASSATVTGKGFAGGLIGTCEQAKLYNCLVSGRVFSDGTANVFLGAGAGAATDCYYYSTAFSGESPATGVEGNVKDLGTSVSATEAARLLNAYYLTDYSNSKYMFGWTVVNDKPALANATPCATVVAKNETFVFATLADAVRFARQDETSVVNLIRSVRTEGTEIGGNYTLALGKYNLTVTSPLTVSFGTVTITCDGGEIVAPDSATIQLMGGNLNLLSVRVLSRASYALENKGTGNIYLSGERQISGVSGGDIYIGYANTLYGSDKENKTAYTGRLIYVKCGFAYQNGSVIVNNAAENKFDAYGYDSSHYITEIKDGALVFEAISFWVWAIIGILFAGAALLLVITIVKTVRYKKRMKTYSFLPFLPLVFFTARQTGFLIAAGAVIVICLLTMLISGSKQKKKEAEAKAKKNAPAKEEPKEEPVKEAPAEEVGEEPTAEEEVKEEPAAEEPKEEEPAEEPAAEEPKEEEPAEEPAAEEPKEEEPAEEPVAEEPKEEEPAEEPTEEEPAEEPEAEETEKNEESGEETSQIPIVDGNPTVPVAKGDQVVVAERDAAGNMVYSVYKKSFMARLIQSDKEVQERYETVKNALLSYKKVNSRVSWSYDSFKSGHTQLAKITIRGKTPYLYLALDPATLEGSKYNVTDAGKAKKYSTVPCRLRLTSKRSVKWATELVDVLAEKNGLVKNPKFQPETYVSENETTEALIEKGLIKKAQ